MAATVSAKMVRELCTAPEAALVRASRDRGVRDVSIADLRAKRERVRALRDKFRDLAERQRREARGKQSPRGATPSKSNDRTVIKQQIFAEALANFDKRIKAVEAQGGGGSAAKSAGRSTGKTGARRAAPSKEPATRSDRQAMRKKLRIETTTGDSSAGRTLAKRAGKGSAGASPTGSASSAGLDGLGGSKRAKAASSTPARGAKAAASASASAPPSAPPKNRILKKKAVASRSILGKTASKVRTKVTSIPLDAESVVRAGDLDPMAVRTPEVAARSSNMQLDRSARIQRTGVVKIQAHIGSRNRRNQAKRDSAG